MPVFDTGKDLDDIQEPELLPEEWYSMEIIDEPERAMNKKMKEGGADAEGAGYNIVLKLEVIYPDAPQYNGRKFTLWLSMPVEGDEDRFTAAGQTIEDFKLDQIKKVAQGFAGKEISGSEVEFNKGMKADFYVKQGIAGGGARKGQPQNEIDTFAGVKKAGATL